MSHNRKLEDARRRHRQACKDHDEAFTLANQTGRAADRQSWAESLREMEEAQEDLNAAQNECANEERAM